MDVVMLLHVDPRTGNLVLYQARPIGTFTPDQLMSGEVVTALRNGGVGTATTLAPAPAPVAPALTTADDPMAEAVDDALGPRELIPGTEVRKFDPRIAGFAFTQADGWSEAKARHWLSAVYPGVKEAMSGDEPGVWPKRMARTEPFLGGKDTRAAGLWVFRSTTPLRKFRRKKPGGTGQGLGMIPIRSAIPGALIIVAEPKSPRMKPYPVESMPGYQTNGRKIRS